MERVLALLENNPLILSAGHRHDPSYDPVANSLLVAGAAKCAVWLQLRCVFTCPGVRRQAHSPIGLFFPHTTHYSLKHEWCESLNNMITSHLDNWVN